MGPPSPATGPGPRCGQVRVGHQSIRRTGGSSIKEQHPWRLDHLEQSPLPSDNDFRQSSWPSRSIRQASEKNKDFFSDIPGHKTFPSHVPFSVSVQRRCHGSRESRSQQKGRSRGEASRGCLEKVRGSSRSPPGKEWESQTLCGFSAVYENAENSIHSCLTDLLGCSGGSCDSCEHRRKYP